MPKPKAPRKSELLDMGSRALAEHEEAQRRAYHDRIRRDLIERGALVDNTSVEKLLEDAAPRLRDKGWKVTEQREER